jgi:arsenate reductase
MKPLILILCTGNSCRSQMAEGFLRAAENDAFRVASAGSAPAGYVHPMAIEVMHEIGIDLSTHTSKSVDLFTDQPVHTVITVCSEAEAACPVFPAATQRHHWPFDDPPHAQQPGESLRDAFRRVRDTMRPVFETFADSFKEN